MFPDNEKNLLLIGYVFLVLGCIPAYGLFVDICLLIGALIIRANWIKHELSLNHINFMIKTLAAVVVVAIASMLLYIVIIGLVFAVLGWLWFVIRVILGFMAFFKNKPAPQGWFFS